MFAPLVAAVAVAATVSTPSNITKQSGYNGEGTIAVNPTDPTKLFAGFNNHSSTSQWQRSTDSGATWTAAGSGIGSSCCDNQAEWDSFGNLYLVNLNSSVNSVLLYLSTDNGASFSQFPALGTGSVDQPTLKAGPSSIWVAWDVNNGVVARGAAVTGAGAGHIGVFSTAELAPSSSSCQFGDIAVSPAGHVVDVCQTDTQILSYTDPDGLGASGFNNAVVASSTNVDKFDSISPQQNRTVDAEANLAYDLSSGPHAGRLYLVYTDETPDESNNTDIYLRHSDNDGATWSAAVKVNDDSTTRAQFFPVVTVDPTSGNVFVSFLDCRNDPGNTHTQYWGAVSTDGGATFGTNVQLSAGSSSAAGQSDHNNEYGDYSGNDYYSGAAYAIWPDNSNSTGDNPNGTSDFDMYAGKLTGGGGGGGGGGGDTTPPVVTVPADKTIEATSAAGAVANFAGEVSAQDPDDQAGPVDCQPASGSTFPFGQTTVTCSSTDTHGNTGTNSFHVTVQDTTPPNLTLPGNATLDATGPAGAILTFSPAPSATDSVDGAVAVGCTPTSGSTFAAGDTTVNCSATDAHGNTGNGSFNVHVRGAAEQTATLKGLLASFTDIAASIRTSLGKKLDTTIKDLNKGPKGIKAACSQVKSFNKTVTKDIPKKIPAGEGNQLIAGGNNIQTVIGCT